MLRLKSKSEAHKIHFFIFSCSGAFFVGVAFILIGVYFAGLVFFPGDFSVKAVFGFF
jgi:hypothetical protein